MGTVKEASPSTSRVVAAKGEIRIGRKTSRPALGDQFVKVHKVFISLIAFFLTLGPICPRLLCGDRSEEASPDLQFDIQLDIQLDLQLPEEQNPLPPESNAAEDRGLAEMPVLVELKDAPAILANANLIPALFEPIEPAPIIDDPLFGKPERRPRWRDIPLGFAADQKAIWTGPFRAGPNHLGFTAAALGTTAGLAGLVDRRVGQSITGSPTGSGYNFSHTVGTYSGTYAVLGVPTALYFAGRLSGNERARGTGILAVRAVLNTQLVVQALKTTFQRPRPTDTDPNLPNYNSEGTFFAGGNSFPSGHAAGAWSAATVIARQYHGQTWVKVAAYGGASFVAANRVTARRHFPADAFLGSVIGHLIGRYVSRQYEERENPNVPIWQLSPYVPKGGGAAVSFTLEF